MKAGIIAVGDEVLLGRVRNTNSEFLAKMVSSVGFQTNIISVVSDDIGSIVEALKRFERLCDVILITGGLGPTNDDLTREAFCKFVKKKLTIDKKALAKISSYFKERNLEIPNDAVKQAQLPVGANPIQNQIGLAVGFHCRKGKVDYFALPGVPAEMSAMFNSYVLNVLKKLVKGEFFYTKDINLFGLPEVLVQEKLGKMLTMWGNPKISFMVKEGGVTLRLSALAKTQKLAEEMISRLSSKIKPLFPTEIYSEGDVELEDVVANLLEKKNFKIAVVESCTGGLVSSKLANIPGISKNFIEGVVCYSQKSKENLLGCDLKSLKLKSIYTPEVTSMLAEAIAKKTGADIGVAINGIAGPTSPEKDKPVGLVYIAVNYRGETQVKEFRFIGDRNLIREKAARTALNIVRLRILQYKSEKIQESE